MSSQFQAQAFVSACTARGFKWSLLGSGVRITKTFTPEDKAAFSDADMYAYHILALAPLRGGSVWGTDGGSVGGHVGLKNGEYVLSKTGTGANFIKALSRLV